MTHFLTELEGIINNKKNTNPEQSYVARLNQRGINKILEKLSEECAETLLATKDYVYEKNNTELRRHVIHETADLMFHLMVMLSHLDMPIEEIFEELQRRQGKSGLQEKAERDAK